MKNYLHLCVTEYFEILSIYYGIQDYPKTQRVTGLSGVEIFYELGRFKRLSF